MLHFLQLQEFLLDELAEDIGELQPLPAMRFRVELALRLFE